MTSMKTRSFPGAGASSAVASLVAAAIAAVAVCSAAARAERLTPQWSVALDGTDGQHTVAAGLRSSDDGVAANLLRGATRLSPFGLRQWRIAADEVCAAGQTIARVDAIEPLTNGETWLLRSCYSPDGSSHRHELSRIGSDGNLLAQADFGASPAQWPNARLVAQANGVIALVPYADGVRWLRLTRDGTVVDDTFTGLAQSHERVTVPSVRLWPNGSASVAVWQGPNGCNISPPTACPQPATTLLRLNADGSERWRIEAGSFYAFVGFDDDGSSLIAQSTFGESLTLRQVSAAGVAGPSFLAADGEPMHLAGEAGPVRGRYLAFSETEQILIDRNGQIVARRVHAGTAGGRAYASGTHGFITGAWPWDAALVSAEDLSVLAWFDLDGIEDTNWLMIGDLHWRLLDDGTIYTNALRASDVSPPPARARLSRFAVPGTPAADLVFVDHIE